MGSNKEWATEKLTADYDPDAISKWEYSEGLTLNVGSVAESFTVSAYPDTLNAYPDMQQVYDYVHLKEKYPALQQAWEHYQIVLKMCRAKEEEGEN